MQIAQAEVCAGRKRKFDDNSETNKPLTQASLKVRGCYFHH